MTEEIEKVEKVVSGSNPLKVKYIKTLDNLDIISFTMPERNKKQILLIEPVIFTFYEDDNNETQLHMETYLPAPALASNEMVVFKSNFTIISEESDSNVFDIDFINEYLEFIEYFDESENSEDDEMRGNVITNDNNKPTIH